MKHDYANVTDRIARRLLLAALERVNPDDVKVDRGGRMHADIAQMICVRIARQAAKQGLLPVDLDLDEGRDVLCAIAAVVPATRSNVTWQNALTTLPTEWAHVVNAADRIRQQAEAREQAGRRAR